MIKYALSLTRNGKAYAIPLLLHLYPFAFGGIPLLQNLMLQCYHSLGTRGSVVVPLCIIRSFILLPHSCYLTARSPVPVDFYTCTVRILIDNTWSVFYRALGMLGLTRRVLLMYWRGRHCVRFGDVPVVCCACLLAPVEMLEENKNSGLKSVQQIKRKMIEGCVWVSWSAVVRLWKFKFLMEWRNWKLGENWGQLVWLWINLRGVWHPLHRCHYRYTVKVVNHICQTRRRMQGI
jgi:hypothetical protein